MRIVITKAKANHFRVAFADRDGKEIMCSLIPLGTLKRIFPKECATIGFIQSPNCEKMTLFPDWDSMENEVKLIENQLLDNADDHPVEETDAEETEPDGKCMSCGKMEWLDLMELNSKHQYACKDCRKEEETTE